jgi:Xaa-Pro aminopeptidase
MPPSGALLPEEIGMLREAGKIARKVVDSMIEAARPGVPEAVVYAAMINTQHLLTRVYPELR